MSALDYNFTILQYVGVWRPREWSSGYKYHLYNVYSVVVMTVIGLMTFGGSIGMSVSFNKSSNVSESLFLMLTMIGACGKIMTLFASRQRIEQLLTTLETKTFQPNNENEVASVAYYHRSIRFRVHMYSMVIMMTVITMTVSNVILYIPDRGLPIRFWTPVKNTGEVLYGLLFAEEFVSFSVMAVIGAAYDTLVPGYMLEICAQFRIFTCRIQNIVINDIQSANWNNLSGFNSERKIQVRNRIAACVRHHLHIYQFADDVNDIFSGMIFLQYTTSAIILCMNVYAIQTTEIFSSKFIALMACSATMVSQIFMLCYAGSELAEVSNNFDRDIYNINWYLLNCNTRKKILMMMSRCMTPIVFTSASIFEVSLDYFIKIVKISYSAYNLMKSTSGR